MSYTLIQNGDSGSSVRTTINDLLTDINNGVYIGPTGPAGANGTSGSSGSSGANGTSGSSGSSGANGASGSSGSSGSSGANGVDGTTALSVGVGTQSINSTDYFGTSGSALTYSVAIGTDAKAGSPIVTNPLYGSVAIGRKAKALNNSPLDNWGTVAIGDSSSAESYGVAIGTLAVNTGEGVSIGYNASGNGVAVGPGAQGGNARGAAVGPGNCISNSGTVMGWAAESNSQSVSMGEYNRVQQNYSIAIGGVNLVNGNGGFNTLISPMSYHASGTDTINNSSACSILAGRSGHTIKGSTSSIILNGSANIIENQVGLWSLGNGTSNAFGDNFGTFSISGTCSFIALSNAGQSYDYGKNSTLISNADVWVGGPTSSSPVLAGPTTRLVAISSPDFKLGTGTSNVTLINSQDITVSDNVSNAAVIGRNGFTASSSNTIYTQTVDATAYKVNGTSGWSGTFSVTEGIVTVTNGIITGLA